MAAERINLAALDSFCRQALALTGMSAADAAIVAEALVLADSMGVFTHGTKLLGGYLNRLKGGGYRSQGQPSVEREGPAWAVIDGDHALGQIAGHRSIQIGLEKAGKCGVAFVGLKNAGHIGAAGYYAWLATRQGMIAMVTGNDIPSVAAPGSCGPVLGSNPLAYGIPVQGSDPILLDMATAAVAGGKVYAAHQRGETIPEGWLVDANGQPTTDGSLYPQSASLAPFAGHKGYGMGLWAEVLSALLPGGAITWQVGSWMFDQPGIPSRHNASFLLIDVKSIGQPNQFEERLKTLMGEIHAVKAARGVEKVLLPGEREWAHRETALKQGVDLPADVRAKLTEVSRVWEISQPWDHPSVPDSNKPTRGNLT